MFVMKKDANGLITEIAVTASDLNIRFQITVVMAVSLLYVPAYASGHYAFQTNSTRNP
jgi:hypothetical protein